MYIAHGPYANGYWNPGPVHRTSPWAEHEAYREEAERRSGRKLSRAEASRFWYGEAFREIGNDPTRFLELTLRRAVILGNDFEVPDSSHYQVWRDFVPVLAILPSFGWIVGIGMIGICVALRRWQQYGLPLGFVAMYVLSVLLTYNFGRFRIGLVPVWLLFSAAGSLWLLSSWRCPIWSSRGKALLATAALLTITVAAFQRPPAYPNYDAQREAFREKVIQQAEARRKVVELSQRLEQHPDSAELHSRLGHEFMLVGKLTEALEHHQAALRLGPADASLYLYFADDLVAAGRQREAIEQLVEAQRRDPALAGKVHYRLGKAFHELGEVDRAIHHLRLAVRSDPDEIKPGYNLGILLLSHPDPLARKQTATEALALAEKVCAITQWKNPKHLGLLAAAYAEVSRFHDAVIAGERAKQLAVRMGDDALATQLSSHLESYRQGRPAALGAPPPRRR